jgi:hypothetical protein
MDQSNYMTSGFGFIVTMIFGILILCYVYFAITLRVIAKKTNTPDEWMAWVPIANIYLVTRIAGKPWWWTLLSFIPYIGLVFLAILFINLAEARKKSGVWGFLMLIPIVNFFAAGYLAYSE